jgi:hypothetical protein
MTIQHRIIASLSLLIAAAVTVATSTAPDGTPTEVYYGAASNCANATVTNQSIGVIYGAKIQTPEGMTFLTLGIPKANLGIAYETTVSGTITGGLTRVCTYSLNTTSGTLHVYSCSDNNNPVCQVSFTPQ